MSNQYFQFKQFTVYQDKSAMKVCTDSCLFGAWVANYLREINLDPGHLLDIGTGTGLLSLMLAQHTTGQIDAVEIDRPAFEQASENFSKSLWYNRLNGFNLSIQEFARKKNASYDFIICNPPFFENNLISGNQSKNLALHSSALKLEELLVLIKGLLNAEGRFALLIPHSRAEELIKSANKTGFFPEKVTHVKQSLQHGYFRSMICFATKANNYLQEEIVIKSDQQYSSEFQQLLHPYYLHL